MKSGELAVSGGKPVRDTMLPYGRQHISADDIAAVVDILRSDWLTTGPAVEAFEQAFADYTGAGCAVAVSNGTAALHLAVQAADIGPGDEVVVTPLTFAASVNCVLYAGAVPVFADVDPGTLVIDPDSVKQKITDRTKAIIAVDYAGQPCDYDALRNLADTYRLVLIDDASHSPGALYNGRSVGTLADLNTFSFHPVKHMTTGEGGMITTDNPHYAEKMRVARNHGITTDHRQRAQQGSFHYEMTTLGFNYRITDFQCALGISQLRAMPGQLERRQEIAAHYDRLFADLPFITPLAVRPGVKHAYHLYVVRLDCELLGMNRAEVFTALRAENIGVNVHYIPVHFHPYYRRTLGTGEGLCPVAEKAYESILTLPLFPHMTDGDIADVLQAVTKLYSAGA